MVVARDQQHAAVFRGAGEIHVFEHVAAAIDAGPLAIPQRKDAVVIRLADQLDLLRSPHCRGGKFFVHAGLEFDVMGLQMLFGFPQRLVETTQRRAAIPGNEAGRVDSRSQVAPALHQREAHQRLDAGQVNAVVVGGVFVFEGNLPHVRLL